MRWCSFLDTTSPEGSDRSNPGLGGGQGGLVVQAAGLNPRTAVVVMAPGAVLLSPWIDVVPACLLAWLPGQEAEHASADVLFGIASPSAKLPVFTPARGKRTGMSSSGVSFFELELELIQPHMAQKPMPRGEVGARVGVIRASGQRQERRYFLGNV